MTSFRAGADNRLHDTDNKRPIDYKNQLQNTQFKREMISFLGKQQENFSHSLFSVCSNRAKPNFQSIVDSVREIKKSPEKYKNVIEGIVIKETIKEHVLGKNYR